jgi:SAM-dependent methyltransferase
MPETTRFDYDAGEIHRTYASGRVLSAAQRRFWSDLVRQEAGAGAPTRVLDLGCGSADSRHCYARRSGAGGRIDRSARMLAAGGGGSARAAPAGVLETTAGLCPAAAGVGFVCCSSSAITWASSARRAAQCARVLADNAPW